MSGGRESLPIAMLKPGDRVRIISPSHYRHGYTGTVLPARGVQVRKVRVQLTGKFDRYAHSILYLRPEDLERLPPVSRERAAGR